MCNLIQFWLDLINSLQLMSIISLVTLAFGLYSFWYNALICQTKNIFYSKTLGKTFVLMLCSGIFVRKEKHKYHWAVQNILYNLGKIFIFWQFSYLKHNVKYPKTHVNDITQWTQLLSQFRTEPDYHKIKRIHKETKMRGTWALT